MLLALEQSESRARRGAGTSCPTPGTCLVCLACLARNPPTRFVPPSTAGRSHGEGGELGSQGRASSARPHAESLGTGGRTATGYSQHITRPCGCQRLPAFLYPRRYRLSLIGVTPEAL